MKRQILLLLGLVISLQCYSQVNFENGYFIDNTGRRNNVLIKNVDWKNNPVSFEYKTSENAEVKTANINNVQEFGINNISKFYRANVGIARSSEKLNRLSTNREPVFHEEELFLEVLVEGMANLFQYEDSNLTQYYYSIKDSEIQPLIYKRYSVSSTKMGENNRFRQQLLNDLKCPDFTTRRFENLDYEKRDLVKLFREYHKCHNANIAYEPEVTKAQFNLNLRPRANSSSLTLQKPDAQPEPIDFEDRTGFGFGIEAELILPFNRNKWSIIIEPTYQYFKSTGISKTTYSYQENHIFEADYKSIELPFGLRHYFFLNNKSKIFLNTSFVVDFALESNITYSFEDGSNQRNLNIQSQANLALGVGYKYNDRYSLELRYFSDKDVLGEYVRWSAEYGSVSVILGYTLF